MNLQDLLPGEPAIQGVHPPMIYVQEKVVWQYKCISIDLRQGVVPDEKLLNELGAEGWELASTFCVEQFLYVYFKRLENG